MPKWKPATPPELPDPTTLASKNARTEKRICCRDPKLKAWLDKAKAAYEAGIPAGSFATMSRVAREHGYIISSSSIGNHVRGRCGSS